MDQEQPLADRLREAQESLSRLKSLEEHLGWKRIKEILQQQIDNRLTSYGMRPATSIEKVLEEQFAKGEIAGIELAKLVLPHQIIHLETEVENCKRLVLDEQGERDES